MTVCEGPEALAATFERIRGIEHVTELERCGLDVPAHAFNYTLVLHLWDPDEGLQARERFHDALTSLGESGTFEVVDIIIGMADEATRSVLQQLADDDLSRRRTVFVSRHSSRAVLYTQAEVRKIAAEYLLACLFGELHAMPDPQPHPLPARLTQPVYGEEPGLVVAGLFQIEFPTRAELLRSVLRACVEHYSRVDNAALPAAHTRFREVAAEAVSRYCACLLEAFESTRSSAVAARRLGEDANTRLRRDVEELLADSFGPVDADRRVSLARAAATFGELALTVKSLRDRFPAEIIPGTPGKSVGLWGRIKGARNIAPVAPQENGPVLREACDAAYGLLRILAADREHLERVLAPAADDVEPDQGEMEIESTTLGARVRISRLPQVLPRVVEDAIVGVSIEVGRKVASAVVRGTASSDALLGGLEQLLNSRLAQVSIPELVFELFPDAEGRLVERLSKTPLAASMRPGLEGVPFCVWLSEDLSAGAIRTFRRAAESLGSERASAFVRSTYSRTFGLLLLRERVPRRALRPYFQ